MISIITGATLIAIILTGLVWGMATATGWRVALGIFAFAVTVTTIVVGASLLIGYGIESHL